MLVCLSRTRRWWGRFAILLPAAVGLLTALGMLVNMLTTGGNRTSALSVMLLLLWMVAAGYAANQGVQDRLGHPPVKVWRSGIPVLLAYAVVAPAPTAVGRWLFAPELRDAAIELSGNTVGLRLAALWTVSTAWVYLAGLLVGVTIWVMYRWWPTRPGSQVTALLVAIAVMLLLTGAVGWTAASLAADRVHQLRNESPADEAIFTCGAVELEGYPSEPARTVAVTGAGCSTVTIFEGYRQVATQTLPVSVSPVEARTPEGGEITGGWSRRSTGRCSSWRAPIGWTRRPHAVRSACRGRPTAVAGRLHRRSRRAVRPSARRGRPTAGAHHPRMRSRRPSSSPVRAAR